MIESPGYHPDEPNRADLFAETVSFMQPWEGTQPEVPPQEREIVAQAFAYRVDDAILNNFGNLHNEFDVSSVDYRYSLGPDDSIHFRIERDDAGGKKIIDVTHESAYAREAFSYVLGDNGTVIRRDDGDLYKKAQDEPIPPPAEGNPFIDEGKGPDTTNAIEKWNEHIEGMKANSDLEAAMGVNNGAVGLGEATQIFDLLDAADPE